MRVVVILVLLLAFATPSTADSWPRARSFEVHSPNGLLSVRVDPGTRPEFDLGKTGQWKENAIATVTGPGGERRTFLLLNPSSPVEGVLLDDGTFLGFDNWHRVGHGAVVACYSLDGSVRWSHELGELLSEETIRRIPISPSSRLWRREPLEWATEKDEAGDLFGFVTLWNEDKLRIRLSDGAVEYIEVQDLERDAERLLLRGEDLSRQGRYSAAIEVLERVVALKPSLTQAYQELSRAYGWQRKYDIAVKVLVEGIRENPATEVPQAGRNPQGDSRVWLVLALGRAYQDAGRPQDAEKAFLDCLRLDPGYWNAGQELAGLWLKASRQEEADRLLVGFFEILRGDPADFRESSNLKSAANLIGNFYRNHGLFEKAKKYYLRGYGTGEIDEHLSLDLAETLEALGEYKKAVSVLQEVKTWLTGRKYGEFYLKEAEKDLARVVEKLNAEAKSKDTTVSPSSEPVKPPPFR